MLDSLTHRLSRVVKTLRGEARLTEDNIAEALRMRRHWLLFRERNPAVYAPLTATEG